MASYRDWLMRFPMAATRGTARLGVRLQPRVVVYPHGVVELGGFPFCSADEAVLVFRDLLERA
ncbi:MAG: hypothetical protein KatS3mg061_2680 [Dehalococcoidia bacterium]|nr:MAG: hypothetical protein KatS3mg061_2680 [Dehalococcoidia bacterium]